MGVDSAETPPEATVRVTGQTLRQCLRKTTAPLHDRLDAAMRPPADWLVRAQYGQFLSAQYQARLAVEQWLSVSAPEDLKPPEQTPLLARDLAELGETLPAASFAFALENEGPPSVIGAAWVLAGSSLGNRAMLRDMQRALPDDAHWPAAFLSGDAMTRFWQALRARIETPASPQEVEIAVHAAAHVFEHFLTIAENARPQDVAQDVAQNAAQKTAKNTAQNPAEMAQ